MTQKTKNKTTVATIGFVAIAVIMTSSIIAFDPTLLDIQAAKENPAGADAKRAAVPIGTVLDYFCGASCTIPDGYQVADGSMVTDPASPLVGEMLPDLRDKFVLGTATTGEVGDTGGNNSHTHNVNASNTSTTSDGTHVHSVNPPNTESTSDGIHAHDVNPPNTESTSDGIHLHVGNTFGTFGTNSVTNCLLLACTNVADDTHGHNVNHNPAGGHTHNTDIAAFTSANSISHTHTVDIGAFDSASSGDHTHTVDIPSTTTTTDSTVPEHVVLLKIVRIK